MTRCIIHIGMHKTGSTSIQASLNRLADSRFLYADLGPEPNHSIPLCVLFSSDPARCTSNKPSKRHLGTDPAYWSLVRNRLDAAIGRCGDRTLLISGEDICSLARSDLAGLHRYFGARFDRVEVVAYVRSPAAYLASVFQQRVKGDLDEFNPAAMLRGYEETFGKFDELFGRANVHLWKFDPARFPGGCVVQDFCARLGIHLPRGRVKRANDSLPRPALDLLYCYRKFGKPHGSEDMPAGEAQRLGRVLSALGTDKLRFAPELVQPILERHRADIQWMEERLGVSLDEDLGERRAGDVGAEADLLSPAPQVVEGLLELLGDAAPAGNLGRTPVEVAALVHALRAKVAEAASRIRRRSPARDEPARNAGRVMLIQPNAVLGWAIGSDWETPVQLALLVNGVEVARGVADQPRPALKDRGIHPTGQCGFCFRLGTNQILNPGDVVAVRPVHGDCVIGHSPAVVEPTAGVPQHDQPNAAGSGSRIPHA